MIDRHGVSAAVPYTLLVPFFGVASSVLFLGESLTPRVVFGGAITIAGVAIIVLRRPHLADPVPDAQSDQVDRPAG